MDDMQRYRDIKATADSEDPAAKLRAQLAVAFDEALAEAIRLERQGKTGVVRELGFTETAAELERKPGLHAAYWKLREHAAAYRDTNGYRRAQERWEQSGRRDGELLHKLSIHVHYARGVEAAARDIAEMLGVPEHEIEPTP